MARRGRVPKRPLLKRVFLGCEGESERSYGAWLQKIAKDLKLPIVIDTYPDTGGGDQPHEIIERCIIEMHRRQKLYGPYISRAILLDSDNLNNNPEKDRTALCSARNNRVHVIFQEFEHEAFLLRHIPGNEYTRPEKGTSREALQSAWPEYKRRFGKLQLSEKFTFQDLRCVCRVEQVLCTFLREIGFPV